jgi:hypothetical protein
MPQRTAGEPAAESITDDPVEPIQMDSMNIRSPADRAAEIGLRLDGVTARKTDTGLVPLLCFADAGRFAPGWAAVPGTAGAAASRGRAFDIAVKLQRELGDHWSLAGGHRLLDGGTDSDALYTFARFDFALLSLQHRC